MDLFTSSGAGASRAQLPLAARMRPTTVEQIVGQQHVLADSSPLYALLSAGQIGSSVVLWGPPGTGKTTLARVIANSSGAEFTELSAVSATVKDVRAVIKTARLQRETTGSQTVLFIDEVHRFSKTQQDALLPAVENGWITLVGATTENPSFSVIPALLSRSLVLPLHPLSAEDLATVVERALTDENGLAGQVVIEQDASNHLIRLAGGDARRALTLLETAAGAVLARSQTGSTVGGERVASPAVNADSGLIDQGPFDESPVTGPVEPGPFDESPVAGPIEPGPLDEPTVTGPNQPGPFDESPVAKAAMGKTSATDSTTAEPAATSIISLRDVESASMHAAPRYDRAGDRHYDVASALIKSLRGSDVDAALHYLAVMIEAGEDPRFIARRLMILASEDIGMADPSALSVTTAAHTAVSSIGLPEARIILAQATVHLALAPKSNAVYKAIDAALADVRAGKTGPVPDQLRDASTKSARDDGAGSGYRYPHDEDSGVAVQQYAPTAAASSIYYHPTTRGAEARAADSARRLRAILRGSGPV